MRRLKVRTDGTAVKALKQAVFLLAFLFLAVPALFYGSGFPVPPALHRALRVMSLTGTTLLLAGILTAWLFSRFSPVKLVITAQKLNATDLPKSITEQCQTRIILGGLVSEETFHQATGLYKKDTAGVYRGSVMKGYAVTPKSEGLCYVETPFLPKRETCYVPLLKKLGERGTPHGEAR